MSHLNLKDIVCVRREILDGVANFSYEVVAVGGTPVAAGVLREKLQPEMVFKKITARRHISLN